MCIELGSELRQLESTGLVSSMACLMGFNQFSLKRNLSTSCFLSLLTATTAYCSLRHLVEGHVKTRLHRAVDYVYHEDAHGIFLVRADLYLLPCTNATRQCLRSRLHYMVYLMSAITVGTFAHSLLSAQ